MIVISEKRDIVTDTMRLNCGLAAGNMQLAAESLGLGARIVIEPVQEINEPCWAFPKAMTFWRRFWSVIRMNPLTRFLPRLPVPLSNIVNYAHKPVLRA